MNAMKVMSKRQEKNMYKKHLSQRNREKEQQYEPVKNKMDLFKKSIPTSK